MKKTILIALALAAAVGTASAGTLGDAGYRLFWLGDGTGSTRVYSIQPLPAGSNVAGTNVWRYDYEVTNKSASPLNTFLPFFNSNNLDWAHYSGGTAPVNWTLTQLGPLTGQYNYKIRIRTTIQASKIPQNGTLFCSVTFTWLGTSVPGPQAYDFVTDGGSESGTTVELVETSRVHEVTWGRLRKIYTGVTP